MNDLGGRLSWSALLSFISNLQPDSALAREVGGYSGWESTLKTNLILADIFDVLNSIAHGLSGKKTRIKPYPRPFDKEKDKKKIGSGSLRTVTDLRHWIEEKRNGR